MFKLLKKSTITDKNNLITVTWVFVIRYFTPLVSPDWLRSAWELNMA